MEEHISICSVSQSFYPYIGGLARYVDALGRKFVTNGHQFKVVHFKTSETPVIDFSHGLEITRVNIPKLGEETLSKYMEFKELILQVTHGEVPKEVVGYEEYLEVNSKMAKDIADAYSYKSFDVLHVHDFQTLLLGRLLREEYKLNIPMVFTWHVPFIAEIPEFWKNFFVSNMKYYDKVVFSIPEYTEAAIKCGLEPERIVTMPPFIDVNGYPPKQPNKARTKYSISPDDFLIACVSRMDPRKGQEVLIEALDEIINKHKRSSVKCLFVGNGSFSKKMSGDLRQNRVDMLKEMVESKGLSQNVFFTGRVDDSDLYSIYHDCDVAIQPSLHEGFGLTITEAMVLGKAVIGSRIGGIPIQIEDGVNGYLFEKGNSTELASKIMHLMDNRPLLDQMGQKGIETVKNKFSSEVGYSNYLKIYKDALELHKSLSLG
jgi:glycosyltransferase involved in cell wall biosynthesis